MDAMVHTWFGTYGISAFTTSIARCFGDKKAEYIEKPIFNEILKEESLTQEELDNRELQKMILAEEMWIKNDKKRGLKETIIK